MLLQRIIMSNKASRQRQSSRKQSASSQIQVQQHQMEQYFGPLPRPDHFRQFNDVLPGAAERILSMAEQQSGHRHQMEHREQTLEYIYAGIGMLFAFVISISTIAGSVACIIRGANISGTLLGGIGVVTISSLMIKGRRISNQSK